MKSALLAACLCVMALVFGLVDGSFAQRDATPSEARTCVLQAPPRETAFDDRYGRPAALDPSDLAALRASLDRAQDRTSTLDQRADAAVDAAERQARIENLDEARTAAVYAIVLGRTVPLAPRPRWRDSACAVIERATVHAPVNALALPTSRVPAAADPWVEAACPSLASVTRPVRPSFELDRDGVGGASGRDFEEASDTLFLATVAGRRVDAAIVERRRVLARRLFARGIFGHGGASASVQEVIALDASFSCRLRQASLRRTYGPAEVVDCAARGLSPDACQVRAMATAFGREAARDVDYPYDLAAAFGDSPPRDTRAWSDLGWLTSRHYYPTVSDRNADWLRSFEGTTIAASMPYAHAIAVVSRCGPDADAARASFERWDLIRDLLAIVAPSEADQPGYDLAYACD